MTIHAPYNFVPLSKHICDAKDVSRISHDVPFKDGLSGSLPLTLTAHTPLIVGGLRTAGTKNSPSEVSFFRLPDKTLALPGSSVRGMVRAVVEIASFGKMKLVDDKRFGLRDLTGALKCIYGSEMTTTEGGAHAPRVDSGWLTFADARWKIFPCSVARIEQSDLEDYGKVALGHSQSARRKYEAWKGKNSLNVRVALGGPQAHRHSCGPLWYDRATLGGQTPGVLVFTGQPSRRNDRPLPGKSRGKHMEFVFHSERNTSLEVPETTMRGFLDIHERSEKESEAWLFWRERMASGDRVPVFYLKDHDGQVKSLGLAQMYKRAYAKTVHELIANTNKLHLSEVWDMADAIFGRVLPVSMDEQSLRARVSFSTMRYIGGGELCTKSDLAKDRRPLTTLAAPKPSYLPNYVRQSVDPRFDGSKIAQGKPYKTYDDPDAELRGWKRYPVRPAPFVPPPPVAGDNQMSNVRLEALECTPTNPSFKGTLRFHNLRPFELGAVLWAMTWGGDGALRHALGMGKPMGFGQVSIAIDGGAETEVTACGGARVTLQDCMEHYIGHMERWWRTTSEAGTWQSSDQIRQLKAMADPSNANLQDNSGEYRPLRHMDFNNRRNEFQGALSSGRALPEYWAAGNGARRGIPNFDWQPPRRNLPAATKAPAAQPAAQPQRPPGVLINEGERVTYEGETYFVVVNVLSADRDRVRVTLRHVSEPGEEQVAFSELLRSNPHLRDRLA